MVRSPRASASPHPTSNTGRKAPRAVVGRRAFTVIELMVTILIVVIVLAGVGFGIANLRRAGISTAAGILDSAARYLYQRAAIDGSPYRLAMDLEGGTWKGEQLDLQGTTCGTFTVADTRVEKPRIRTQRASDRRREREALEADQERCPEEERDAEGRCPAQGFEGAMEQLLGEHTLPKGVRFAGVMTTHQQDIQKEGKAYVYFFPNGNIEKAYIYLETDEDTFTIETFPLLGKVRIHNKELSLSRFRQTR